MTVKIIVPVLNKTVVNDNKYKRNGPLYFFKNEKIASSFFVFSFVSWFSFWLSIFFSSDLLLSINSFRLFFLNSIIPAVVLIIEIKLIPNWPVLLLVTYFCDGSKSLILSNLLIFSPLVFEIQSKKTSKRHKFCMTFPCIFWSLSSETKKHKEKSSKVGVFLASLGLTFEDEGANFENHWHFCTKIYKREMKFWAILASRGCREKKLPTAISMQLCGLVL